jgi:hypothetical protein
MKLTEATQSPEAASSVMITGEKLQRIIDAQGVYERDMEALQERDRVFHEELQRDRDRAYERVHLAVNAALDGTELIGLGPKQVQIVMDFAEKHGVAFAYRTGRPDDDGKPDIIKALERVLGPGIEIPLGRGGIVDLHLGGDDEEKK